MKHSNEILKMTVLIFALILAFSKIPLVNAQNLPNPTNSDKAEQELFIVAQRSFDDGFYDVANRYIQQFLSKYPKSEKLVQAKLLLGQCYFFQSQYLKAYEVFQNLLSFSEYKDATLYWLGETYFKGADYKQAQSYYSQVIDVYPQSEYLPQATYALAWSYFEQGNYKIAKQNFLKLINEFPGHQLSEDAAFKLGECEQNQGNYKVAANHFKDYIIKYPHSNRHPQAYFYIGEGYYYVEDYLTAITYYAKAADISYTPDLNVLAKTSMGWCYLKLGKHDLAQKAFEEARSLADEKKLLSDEIYLGQATLFLEMGNNELALANYSALIEKFPSSPRVAEARLGMANIYYSLKNYDKAVRGYQAILSEFQNDPKWSEIIEKATYGLAWTYLKAGNVDLAVKNFQDIMNKTDSKIVKVSALTQIADAYQETDELEKALKVYDQILRDYPDSLYTDYVQYRQGIALLKLNRVEAATLSFQTMQTNFPKSKYLEDVNYYLALAYFKKEDWRQTVEKAEEYLKQLPSHKTFETESQYILGLSLVELKQYQEAFTTFQKLLKTPALQDPMLHSSELNLAKCFYHLGDKRESVKRFKLLFQRYQDSDTGEEALLWLGDHELKEQNFSNAIEHYEKFVQTYPLSQKLQIVYYELGVAYQAEKQWEKALHFYRLVDDPSAKEVYTKAKLAAADIFSQQTDDGEASLERYLKIADNNPDYKRDALGKIASIYYKQQNYEKAVDFYRQALAAEKGLSEILDPELEFLIGDAFELANQTKEAVEAYLRIPYLYSEAKQWCIKAYLRVARIFEDQEQWQEAKGIYEKVSQYQSNEAKYANERIQWIDQNVFQKAN